MSKPVYRDVAFKHRLAEALRVTRMSQRTLATKLNLNAASVNRWLKGKTEPVRTPYEKIATALGVPLDMIAGVVARRVPVSSGAGNIALPLRDARDVGRPIPARTPLQTIEVPEWLVAEWFDGVPIDERASAYRLLDDSLEPTISAGAVLVLDASESARGWAAAALDSNRIYALRPKGVNGVVFRRLSFDDGTIICEPVNPDRKRYPVMLISSEASKVPSFVPAVVVGRIERMK